jgi:hypothetical protein
MASNSAGLLERPSDLPIAAQEAFSGGGGDIADNSTDHAAVCVIRYSGVRDSCSYIYIQLYCISNDINKP